MQSAFKRGYIFRLRNGKWMGEVYQNAGTTPIEYHEKDSPDEIRTIFRENNIVDMSGV